MIVPNSDTPEMVLSTSDAPSNDNAKFQKTGIKSSKTKPHLAKLVKRPAVRIASQGKSTRLQKIDPKHQKAMSNPVKIEKPPPASNPSANQDRWSQRIDTEEPMVRNDLLKVENHSTASEKRPIHSGIAQDFHEKTQHPPQTEIAQSTSSTMVASTFVFIGADGGRNGDDNRGCYDHGDNNDDSNDNNDYHDDHYGDAIEGNMLLKMILIKN